MTPPHDTPENLVRAMACILFAVLVLDPGTDEIPIKRDWLTRWLRDLVRVLDHFEHPH